MGILKFGVRMYVCAEDTERMEHFLSHCPAFVSLRYKYNGAYTIYIADIGHCNRVEGRNMVCMVVFL